MDLKNVLFSSTKSQKKMKQKKKICKKCAGQEHYFLS